MSNTTNRSENPHHRDNGCARLGDKCEGKWRDLEGNDVPFTGTLVSSSGGFVAIVTDKPVSFRPGDVRNEVTFTKHEVKRWRTVADGPKLDWCDVSGSFGDQALTASGRAKCGLPAEG